MQDNICLRFYLIEITATGFDQRCHAYEPIAKLRSRKDFCTLLLPHSHTFELHLGHNGEKWTAGIGQDAVLCNLGRNFPSELFEKFYQIIPLPYFA